MFTVEEDKGVVSSFSLVALLSLFLNYFRYLFFIFLLFLIPFESCIE